MTGSGTVAALLAARRIVEFQNPDLLDRNRRRWERWIDRQRSPLARPSGERVTIVARISCLADLWLHSGPIGLLTHAAGRLAFILTLPTKASANLAKAEARREEWEGLVEIVEDAECLPLVRDLGEHSRIVEFRLPSTIAAVTVEQLLDSAAEQESIDSSALYIGPAGAWSGCNPDSRAVSFIRLVEPLLSAESADSERAERTEAPAHEPSVHKGWSGRISGHAGTLQVPDPGLDEDIVVSTLAARKDPAVFLRRPVRSGMLGSELTIRVPTRLVGVKGQRVRVERQSPRSTQREDLLLTVPPSRLQPWMLSAFLNRGGGGNRVIRAFAESVGCRIAYAEDEPAKLRDIPVVWGVLRGSDRILAQAKTQGLYYFYIDHAYFDRGHGNSYRITRNGYEAGAIRDCPEDRLTRLKVTTREWRKSGREIIVCPPTEYFMTSHGCPNWLEDTLRALQGITDRPIIIREKPKAGGEAVPLPQALESAHALVTHSSNVAIEAVCLGTPVFVASSSAAAPVGQTDLRQIETPAYPDRQAWLCHLAYNQFSIDEIGDGSAWRMLLDFEERPLV